MNGKEYKLWKNIPATYYKGPLLNVNQMREVDRLMVGKYGIKLIQMMENAGRCLGLLAMHMLQDLGTNQIPLVTVFAGSGGNGGGAMVAARRLYGWGSQVKVVVSGPVEKMQPVVQHQLEVLRAIGIEIYSGELFLEKDPGIGNLAIDGLIGYSLDGNPRGMVAELIRKISVGFHRVLSLDVPSGLDLNTGMNGEPVVTADATLTLALPKTGLCTDQARQFTGAIYLADIGVPAQLYLEPELGIKVPDLFLRGDLIHLERPS